MQHMTATLVRSYEHTQPARGRQPGQRAGRCRRRLDGRLGPGRLPVGDRAARAGAVQRPPAARLGVLPDVRGALERAPDAAAGARAAPAPARQGRDRRTRAGTAPPKSPPGGCSRAPRRARLAPVASAARSGFETAIPVPGAAPGGYVRGAGARRGGRGHRRLGDGGRRSARSGSDGRALTAAAARAAEHGSASPSSRSRSAWRLRRGAAAVAACRAVEK